MSNAVYTNITLVALVREATKRETQEKTSKCVAFASGGGTDVHVRNSRKRVYLTAFAFSSSTYQATALV